MVTMGFASRKLQKLVASSQHFGGITSFYPKNFLQHPAHRFCSYASKRSVYSYSYSYAPPSTPMISHTVGSVLDDTTERYPDRECLVFCEDGVRRTFSQLLKEVNQLAAGLVKLGYKRGDRIGIWGPSSLEWVLTQFATAKIGAILVNINPAYQAREVEYALLKVGCKAVISAAQYKTQNYYNMFQTILQEMEQSQSGKIKSKSLPDLSRVIMMGSQQRPGTITFDDVMQMGSTKDIATVEKIQKKLQFDDAINIQFTSGTTGHPKGATLSHHNIINNAMYIGERMGFNCQADRVLCQVPLYHCFGMVAGVMCMAVHGIANIFPVPGYDPEASVKSLRNENCTTIFGTPTMFIDVVGLAEKQNVQFSQLKKGIMAGSPCPVEVVTKADQILGTTIQVAYGSTETSPVVTLMKRDDPIGKRTKTVGSSLDNTENKVVDSHGDIVPVNTPGELLSRGYCVMQKYWGDEKKSKEAIDERGWYHSGDVAEMDEDGYFKVVGRIKDVIIRGGENIYPTEIEDFLHTHPKVDDVQVIGLPDARMGEEVGAWIRLKPGETATANEIKEFCKEKLSHFKIPKYIKFVEEFPVTITRKVQKYKIKKEFAEELELSN